MNVYALVGVSLAYLALLYLIANLVERSPNNRFIQSAQGWIYSLSIAVYCTSWTFYGSVGRSVKTGIGFLPIYIGPILVFLFGGSILRKMLHISKEQHTTSIADFISSRYGKSHAVAVIVSIICLIGILPYIALQLEAVTNTFNLLTQYPEVTVKPSSNPFYADTTFYVAVLIGLFVIIFGTRRVDVTEQHHGIMSAIAFESIIKLGAFLAVGLFVTLVLFQGWDHLFVEAAKNVKLAPLLDFGKTASKIDFWALTFLAALAILCLPRQFQVIFVENTNESNLKPARWVFPLYLIAINIFVLPLALAGSLTFAGMTPVVNPDTFVMTLPVSGHNQPLAILAFIGGLSAATGMIAVEAIALSTMVCNDLVMPALIFSGLIDPKQAINFGSLVKTIRRIAIMFVVLAGCAYAKLIGGSYALVTIGLLSFVASAQFAPAMLMGLYWKRGNRAGAIAGLSSGFIVWLYTLLLPSFAKSGWLPPHFIDNGLFGMTWLKPYELFGIGGMDTITHGLLWSLLANVVAYVVVSLVTAQDAAERAQADAFVDVFATLAPSTPAPASTAAAGTGATAPAASAPTTGGNGAGKSKSAATPAVAASVPAAAPMTVAANINVGDMVAVLERFIGQEPSQEAFAKWSVKRGRPLDPAEQADADTMRFCEQQLTGVVGAANAQKMVHSIAQFGRDSIWLNPISTKLVNK
jgi:Na+/proline symporter